MNKIQCKNKHFYDADIYCVCPHCVKLGLISPQDAAQTATQQTKSSGGTFWGRFHKKKQDKEPVSAYVPMQEPEPAPAQAPAPAQGSVPAQTPPPSQAPAPAQAPAQHPTPAPGAAGNREPSQASRPEKKTDSIFYHPTSGVPTAPKAADPAQAPAPQPAQQPAPAAAPQLAPTSASGQVSDLQRAVKQSSASEEGATLSYFRTVMQSTPEPTRQLTRSIEPVVGWLVGTDGPHLGESFPLRAGKNSIGRSAANHVVLDLDATVSRSCHSTVIYEPRKREYFLVPGSGSGLTYCDGEVVTAAQKLRDRSRFQLESTELMLVCLCNQEFSWEELLHKEQ